MKTFILAFIFISRIVFAADINLQNGDEITIGEKTISCSSGPSQNCYKFDGYAPICGYNCVKFEGYSPMCGDKSGKKWYKFEGHAPILGYNCKKFDGYSPICADSPQKNCFKFDGFAPQCN